MKLNIYKKSFYINFIRIGSQNARNTKGVFMSWRGLREKTDMGSLVPFFRIKYGEYSCILKSIFKLGRLNGLFLHRSGFDSLSAKPIHILSRNHTQKISYSKI